MPERTEVDGQWVDLDADLVLRADGSLAPVQVIGELWVSGGGPAGSTIASYAGEDFSYSIASPFALPEPTVEGEYATYAEVLPGVDLVVVSNVLGFSHNWVVKDAQAVADPRVASLDLGVDIEGLTPRHDTGGISYVDADGVRQLWSATPLMWDSRGADEVLSPVEAVQDGPAGSDEVAKVAATVSDDSLTLEPDQDLLEDPDVVFPVVVDPPVNRVRNGWTAVWNNFPNKSFWQTEHSLGAGFEGWQQNKVVRSYFRFNTKVLSDKLIISAEVNVRQIHQASCQARATDMYRTGNVGTGTTWNNQPKRRALQDSNSSTAGCGSGTKMVGWNVKKGTQGMADEGVSSGTFMIRGHSESDRMGWKQFDDEGANLDVTYISRPKAPSGVNFRTASGKSYACGSKSKPRVIGSETVFASAKVKSPDGSAAKLRARFELTHGDGLDTKRSSPHAASGTRVDVRFNLEDGRTYRFRVRTQAFASAGTDKPWILGPYNSDLYGTNHRWCYLKVDTTAPPAPEVTSTDFTECLTPSEPDECTVAGQVGQSGGVRVSVATNDTVAFEYRLNSGALARVATTSGAARVVAVTPDREQNTIEVWAVDQAGNRSPSSSEFVFVVAPRQAALRWTFNEDPAGANTGTATGGDLSVPAAAVAEHGRHGRGVRLGAVSAVATPVGPSTGEGFTVAMWVHTPTDHTPSDAAARLIAAPGTGAEVFTVEFDPATSRWSAGAPGGARASTDALAGVWTHVAVSYANNTVRLIINGTTVAQASVTLPASSGWSIGCPTDAEGDPCAGTLVDEIAVFDGPVPATDLRGEVDLVDASGHPGVGSAGMWDMAEDPAANSATDARFGWSLALSSLADPHFGASADGEVASVLNLEGTTTQEAVTSVPVVDTSTSFTTMTRVRLGRGDRSMVLVRHDVAPGEAWILGYRPTADGLGRWVFQKTLNGSVEAEVTSVAGLYAEDWTTLTAVFDATSGEIGLFVNTVAAGEGAESVVPSAPSAGGLFRVGNGSWDGAPAPFAGEIDFVHSFVGAMDAYTVGHYFETGESA